MLLLFIFLLGLVVGSFLNVVIVRLKTEESILGRSHCTRCKKQIYWYDNIPIVSFLWLKGKCRFCGKRISVQYPLVELATAFLFVLAYQKAIYNSQFPMFDYGEALRLWLFSAVLIVIFVYDLRWYLILDVVTIPAIIGAFLINLVFGVSIANLLLATLIGGGFFLLQYAVSKGRWIGGGDIRLGILMGALLGYPQIIVALFIAYLLGGMVAISLLLAGKKHFGDKLPFGAFLSPATVITLLYGERLLTWYLTFF